MMFSQNAFALGAASVNGSLHPNAVECTTGDVFTYNADKKSDTSLLLAVSVDLKAVGSKRFNIVLDGAIWDNSMTSGVFDCGYQTVTTDDDDAEDSDGVTYRRLNDTTLAVSIDRTKVPSNLKFFVPLNCIIVSGGDITVSLDGVVFDPAKDKVVFANAAVAETTEVTTKEKVEVTTTKNNEKVLSSKPSETTTSNRTIKETTTTTVATTTTEATTESTTEAVSETSTEATTEETTQATTETATEATTQASQQSTTAFHLNTKTRVVSFTAGGDNYYVNNTPVYMDVRAYISNDGYMMLPLRAFANALDIDSVSYNSDTKTATFNLEQGTEIAITAGENHYTIDGQTVEIAGKAEIKDGRIFLPLRAMVNAFGISDDYLEYDADSKTATVFIK
jgi:5-deoxy-D-glucuronate isomerase